MRKHGGPHATADVRLRYGPDHIEPEVANTGGLATPRRPGGLGQLGMRERVEASGGSLEVGPQSRGLPRARPHAAAGVRLVTRVLLVDDQVLVRTGFRVILDAQPDIEVVGEAADCSEGVARALELSPDVVCMDVQMPGLDVLESDQAHYIRDRLPLSARAHDVRPRRLPVPRPRSRCIRVPAEDLEPEQLIDVVRVLASGEALLSPAVTHRVIERFAATTDADIRDAGRTSADPAIDALTDREADVFRLLADGLSNAEIAERLYVGEATVKTHVSSILMKLGVRDRVQAVVRAHRSGSVRA